MPTDITEASSWKLGKTGLAAACTLNALVVCSVLAAIPLASHDSEFNPFFLDAFFRQMEAVGVVPAGFAIGDFLMGARRGPGARKRIAAAALVLSFCPLPLGSAVLRLVAAVLGWRLQ